MGSGSMKTGLFRLALFLVCISTTVSAQSSSCSYSFSQNRAYAACVSLTQLSSFLHWTYNASTGTADIAFRATSDTASATGNWVAWALNPTGDGMIGAQALVAYKNSSGSMRSYMSSVPNTDISTLTESALSFSVSELSAESIGTQIIIFAKIQLPSNRTSMNHVWQVGPLSGGSPVRHELTAEHQSSKGEIDFLSGVAQAGGGGSRQRKKNVHGILNALSWGILFPIGFLIARYLKVFESADPAWFYLHILCQCSAYVIGVAGWGIGLKLGSESPGITYHSHRNIGIALFCFATLQVFALLMRPNKEHKYRLYWNIYHRSIGYAIIAMGIINVFKGLDILDPDKKWKTIYIIILIVLGSIALLLEASTWIIVLMRKKKGGSDPKNPYVPQNGYDGPNVYGTRSQPSV